MAVCPVSHVTLVGGTNQSKNDPWKSDMERLSDYKIQGVPNQPAGFYCLEMSQSRKLFFQQILPYFEPQ